MKVAMRSLRWSVISTTRPPLLVSSASRVRGPRCRPQPLRPGRPQHDRRCSITQASPANCRRARAIGRPVKEWSHRRGASRPQPAPSRNGPPYADAAEPAVSTMAASAGRGGCLGRASRSGPRQPLPGWSRQVDAALDDQGVAVIPFGLLDARLTRRRSCTFSTPPNRRGVVTENIVDYPPPDAREHAGLLLINARRWARTPSGLPRL